MTGSLDYDGGWSPAVVIRAFQPCRASVAPVMPAVDSSTARIFFSSDSFFYLKYGRCKSGLSLHRERPEVRDS